jgi:hypothetical protein
MRPMSSHRFHVVSAAQVYLSTDGNSWGSPVASGTFADNADLKTFTLAAKAAKGLRIVTRTEAGTC